MKFGDTRQGPGLRDQGDGRLGQRHRLPDGDVGERPGQDPDRDLRPRDGTVGGSVPATLSLTLGTPASFGAFTPGVAKAYTATTTANVISTAGDATLSVSDPSDHGHGQARQRHVLARPAADARAPAAAGPAARSPPVGGSPRRRCWRWSQPGLQRPGDDRLQAADRRQRRAAHRLLREDADVHPVRRPRPVVGIGAYPSGSASGAGGGDPMAESVYRGDRGLIGACLRADSWEAVPHGRRWTPPLRTVRDLAGGRGGPAAMTIGDGGVVNFRVRLRDLGSSTTPASSRRRLIQRPKSSRRSARAFSMSWPRRAHAPRRGRCAAPVADLDGHHRAL